MAEGVQIIKKMWSEERTTFKGKYYTIEGAYCNPKPDPPPPIMIGGVGEKLMLKVIAQHADWWNASESVEKYERKLKVLETHCNEVGRDFHEIKKTIGGLYVAIGETEEEAEDLATRSPFITQQKYIPASLIGTPRMILDQLKRYIDLGVEYVILRFEDFPSTKGAELFVDEVMSKIN